MSSEARASPGLSTHDEDDNNNNGNKDDDDDDTIINLLERNTEHAHEAGGQCISFEAVYLEQG